MTFKNFYFNIEEKIAAEENEKDDKDNENNTNTNIIKRRDSKKGTKTHTTSKNSTKKIGDDPVVIHNIRGYNSRKSARFKGIVPDSGNKIVSVLRRDSKSGTVRANLKDNEDK